VLELTDLHKAYGTVRALDGLSLTAREGRILGFLGPNGAGKTTSMRSVFGLVELDAGSTTWRGAPVDGRSRLRFGYMPEQRGLYPRMPAERQLAFLGRLHGMAADDAEAAARTWLEQLGLAERGDEPVSALSHGNQQRVQLAASLVHEPDLLVLDEPFSGLDPLGVAAMSDVLTTRAAEGATVVFSSHQLDLVEDLVDDVVIVAHGQDRLAGTLDEVRRSTGTQSVTFRLAGGHVPSTLHLSGHEVDVRAGRDGRGRLQVPRDTPPGVAMAALAGHGVVERFSFGPPSLSEVFRDVVGVSLTEVEARHGDPGDPPVATTDTEVDA
jgi:ABC-2 type transport system ATP-binding protein